MIHAAYELFCTHGIEGATVAQLAQAAQVSPSSIARYFPNRAALVQATQTILWEEIAAQILSGSAAARAAAQNGLEELEVLLSSFKKLYTENSKLILFAYDYKSFLLHNQIRVAEPFYHQITRQTREAFLSALERGQADGSICAKELPFTQFLILWRVMLSFVDEMILCDRIYTGENPWKEQFDMVLHHVLSALGTK